MKSFTTISVFVFVATFSNAFAYSDVSMSVKGATHGVKGDFEKYICEIESKDREQTRRNAQFNVTWFYVLKSGQNTQVADEDRLVSLESRSTTKSGSTRITSFIKLGKTDIQGIMCKDLISSQTASQEDIQVLDLKTADDFLCDDITEYHTPVTVIQRLSSDLLPSIRKARIVSGESLKLQYPDPVAQVKLTCFSRKEDVPRWSFDHNTASKMQYAAWSLPTASGSCNAHVLQIFNVKGEPGEVVEFSPFCRLESSAKRSDPVKLSFEFKPTRSGPPATVDNATNQCVNDIVDKFYDKELTGVSVGGSFAIILMMVGIAVLKKQLNQEKKNNGTQPPPAEGESSREKLTPTTNEHSANP